MPALRRRRQASDLILGLSHTRRKWDRSRPFSDAARTDPVAHLERRPEIEHLPDEIGEIAKLLVHVLE